VLWRLIVSYSDKFVLFNRSPFRADGPVLPASSRAARYGDAIFETVRLARGGPIWWELHRARLLAGADALRLEVDIDALEADIKTILDLNSVIAGLVRISVSRAGGERGYKPRSRMSDTLLETIECNEIKWEEPLKVGISSYKRPSPAALPPGCKLAQGLTSTLAGIEAQESGYDDAILLSEDGFVSEATSANIFWRKGSKLYTPSRECGIVDGVLRQRIIEQRSVDVEQGAYSLEDLLSADEVFMTNVVIGVRSIREIFVGPERHYFYSTEAAKKSFRENVSIDEG
jgi:branched-subunit amino acid aminotransferase/4-amino-4-deoxychorismate lyase